MPIMNYHFNLFTSPIWRQNLESTWVGIDNNYKPAFIDRGCYLCSITMLTAYMEDNANLTPAAVAARGVTTMSDPYIQSWTAASNQFTLVPYTDNIMYRLARTLIVDRKPVIIQVPNNHAVVAYGFNGSVTVDNGTLLYGNVPNSCIKIYDPYKGRCDNDLDKLIRLYGNITKIRIPE